MYAINIENGDEVANNFITKQPLHLTAGAEQSIEGVDACLLTMKYGEKCRLNVSYEYGFGKYDNPHGFHASGILIPARSTLYFELHLLDPNMAKAKNSKQWLETADQKKNEGNTAFSKKDWDSAITHYNKALDITVAVKKNIEQPLAPDAKDTEKEKIQKEREECFPLISTINTACLSNIAACYLSKREFTTTKEWCRKALEEDPRHVKSLWRLAKAHREQDEFDLALQHLQQAQGLSDTKEIRNEIATVQKLRAEKNKAEQKAFGGFFNRLGSEGLYEEGKNFTAPGPKMWKCNFCGEEMDAVQQARHIIKKHGDPKEKKEKWDGFNLEEAMKDVNMEELMKNPAMADILKDMEKGGK